VLAFEEQHAAGAQDPAELGQRPARVLDERQRAAAAHGGVEARRRVRQRLDVPAGEGRARHAVTREQQQAGRDVQAVRTPATLGQHRRLKARPAAGVESAAAGDGRRAELGAHDAVEHGVEVLVPGLEAVIRGRHGVEEIAYRRAHRARW
jgi:hypothetical protein